MTEVEIGVFAMAMIDDVNRPGDLRANVGLDAVSKLQKLSVDIERGFTKMVEKAEPAFQATAKRFLDLHSHHVGRLNNMVREMGGEPDADGSLMGSVNVAVVSVRAAFDTIDLGVMDLVRSGEDNVVSAFDRAIAAGLPQAHRGALTQMKSELTRLLDETRTLG